MLSVTLSSPHPCFSVLQNGDTGFEVASTDGRTDRLTNVVTAILREMLISQIRHLGCNLAILTFLYSWKIQYLLCSFQITILTELGSHGCSYTANLSTGQLQTIMCKPQLSKLRFGGYSQQGMSRNPFQCSTQVCRFFSNTLFFSCTLQKNTTFGC